MWRQQVRLSFNREVPMLLITLVKIFLIGINIKEHKVFRLSVELGCKKESLSLTD